MQLPIYAPALKRRAILVHPSGIDTCGLLAKPFREYPKGIRISPVSDRSNTRLFRRVHGASSRSHGFRFSDAIHLAAMTLSRQFKFAALLMLGLLLAQSQLDAAERQPSGQLIYKQLCARCHGNNGGGVKGKYDDALHGDWSLEKLTRYIDKNMPDDAPEKCVGEDAAEVARYIYDAFYSTEARTRYHPPRVELARLTNRQYVHTIADLIKSFGANDDLPGQERGLRGNYRPRTRKGQEEGKSFDRVDRQVSYTFGTNSPDAERLGTGTNEFNVTWRGSVLAD